ncbi:TlyA family RNA methyltransferase [Limoniibacter endophyticus]|uniref:Hemolysin n=1 Tax=Limoniibacter endophyticus TaxID=1565040 RepID=A0A8J3DIJ6_9HYPH|nr:TlyA family RNA methyltransferase [Limoniibacter endophyticus]GHC71468.1 hemolysin [Limoniibacter endophyticus]
MNTSAQEKMRLDEALVMRNLSVSRSRAKDAIQRGHVVVNGKPVRKPGQIVAVSDAITVSDPAGAYVSRAALKLVKGLEHFGFDPAGKLCLDIGASTGGFTQVLLEKGARHVVAVDVGHDQMDMQLRDNPRVSCIEGLNARAMTLADIGGKAPEFLVSDVSFISLKLALPPALAFASPGAVGIFLVKPQFEAGREAIGRGGLLRDASLGEATAQDMGDWLLSQEGWMVEGLTTSPIEGGDGNREFLLAGRKRI